MFELLNNLHFLRPEWFLALLPVIWIIWKAWQTSRKQGAWHEVIAPKFRHLLLGENSTTGASANEKIGYLGLSIAWFFAVLALSGPWVKSVDIPAEKSQQGVVIVLDLSLSMLADDLSPNRISRVKYKLTDLLKQYPQYATGMVVYAGTAHTISPISEDNQTLLGLLPSLNPVMMPKFGSKPLQGLKLAQKLFDGAQITNRHIVWITDDIEKNQIQPITTWLNDHNDSVTVMTVGTTKGGVVQVPNYGLLKDNNEKLIMPKVPFERFAELEKKTNIKWIDLKPEDTGVKNLLPPDMANTDKLAQSKHAKEVNHPLDIGAYFLFLLLPIVALVFRRGTLLSLVVITVLPIGLLTPKTSYAMDYWGQLPSIFQSLDQQGYEAWENKKYGAAEALFENQQWKASALYRQGKYAQAAKIYALDKTPTGYYNYGNTLALTNKLEEAKKAYEHVLKLKPDFTQAKDNLAVINKLLAQKPKKPELPPQKDEQKGQSPKNQQNPSDSKKDHPDQENKKDKPSQNPADDSQTNQKNDEKNSDKSGDEQKNQGSEDKSQNPQQADNQKQDGAQKDQGGNNDSNNQQKPSESKDNQDAGSQSGEQPNNQANNSSQSSMNNKDKNDLNDNIAEEGNTGANDKPKDSKENKQDAAPSKLMDTPHSDKTIGQGDGAKPNKKLTEKEQAQQSWLKQIPDQPGLFLKRKFEYQFQQNPSKNDPTEKQW
ncbi:VWA domain-containing protein [Thiomicrorhabdus hydrogeniphila]